MEVPSIRLHVECREVCVSVMCNEVVHLPVKCRTECLRQCNKYKAVLGVDG